MFGGCYEREKAEKFFVKTFFTSRIDERSEEMSSVNGQARSFKECVFTVKLLIAKSVLIKSLLLEFKAISVQNNAVLVYFFTNP